MIPEGQVSAAIGPLWQRRPGRPSGADRRGSRALCRAELVARLSGSRWQIARCLEWVASAREAADGTVRVDVIGCGSGLMTGDRRERRHRRQHEGQRRQDCDDQGLVPSPRSVGSHAKLDVGGRRRDGGHARSEGKGSARSDTDRIRPSIGGFPPPQGAAIPRSCLVSGHCASKYGTAPAPATPCAWRSAARCTGPGVARLR
jgi:hypothetical protein